MFRGDLKASDHVLRFGDVTYVMGVINMSPESKNPHTVAATPDEAVRLADRYRQWGADLVDVGGQSSHIDNPTIGVDEEISRLVPVILALIEAGHLVSVDTWKPEVAAAALEVGAPIINDTGGLKSPEMREVLAASSAAAVAVHVDGEHPHEVAEVLISADKAEVVAAGFEEMLDGIGAALAERVILDPGIAINYRGDYLAYTRLQLDVIRHLGAFARLQRPVLVPIPRKRDIHWVTAYIAMALEHDADLIRVHDVAVAAELTRLWDRRVAGG